MGSDDRVRAAVNSMVGEESLRAVVHSLLPKDAAQSLRSTLDDFHESLRAELLAFLSQRADRILDEFNIREELGKFLSETQIEIHATISVHPKGSSGGKRKPATKITIHSAGTDSEPETAPGANVKSASPTSRKKRTTASPKKTAKPQPKKKAAPKKGNVTKKTAPSKKRTARKRPASSKG